MAASVRCASALTFFTVFWLLASHSLNAAGNICSAGQIVALTQNGSSLSSWQKLQEHLQNKRYVFVGERHGVKEHPVILTCILDTLRNFQTELHLEHITADKQSLIDTYRKRHPEHSGGLGKALRWWETGWPDWQTYAPVFERSWNLKTPLFAADLPNSSQLFTQEKLHTLIGAQSIEIVSSWSQTMTAAHCGLIDEARSKELGLRQVTRDLHMATQIASSKADKIILFAGRAHIRKDRSVPYILATRKPHQPVSENSTVTIALYETHLPDGAVDRNEILEKYKGQYDYVWFVGTSDQEDTCTRLDRLGIKK